MSKMTIQHCIEINREKIILDSVHIMPKVEREVFRLFLTKFLVEFCKQYIMRGLASLIEFWAGYNYPVLNWHHLHHTLYWHHYIRVRGHYLFKTTIHWRQTTVNDNMLVWSLLASMVLWFLWLPNHIWGTRVHIHNSY